MKNIEFIFAAVFINTQVWSDSWFDVADEIVRKIDKAEQHYSVDNIKQAKFEIVDAYWSIYDQQKMKSAVQINISSKHAWKYRQLFNATRKLIDKKQSIKEITKQIRQQTRLDAQTLNNKNIPLYVFHPDEMGQMAQGFDSQGLEICVAGETGEFPTQQQYDDLIISDVYAFNSPKGVNNGAIFLKITNLNSKDEVMLSASSEFAKKVELHTHVDDNGVKRMHQVMNIKTPARDITKLEPGGLHIMLLGMKKPLVAGEKIKFRIRFKSGIVKELYATVKIRSSVKNKKKHDIKVISTKGLGGNFTLFDQDGSVSLKDFKDKVVLLYFGYTFCPDVCPTNLALMSQAFNQLSKSELDSVQGVFISVDPDRDSPEHLFKYSQGFHSKIIGLSGSSSRIKEVASKYGSVYKINRNSVNDSTYTVDHSSATYVIGKDGNLNKILPHAAPASEILVAIRKELNK